MPLSLLSFSQIFNALAGDYQGAYLEGLVRSSPGGGAIVLAPLQQNPQGYVAFPYI
jgi:hypothetical protein